MKANIEFSPKAESTKKQQPRPSSKLKPVNFTQQEIDLDRWRRARLSARNIFNPNRRTLMEVYEESILDNHLQGLLKTRKFKAVGAPFSLINKEQKPDVELLKIFRRPWFKKFLNFSVESRFFGYTLIELGQFDFISDLKFNELSDVKIIDRKLVEPSQGLIKFDVNSSAGISYREKGFCEYIIEVGDEKDYGELEVAVPEIILKRYVRNDWARRAEKTGIPITLLSTVETDSVELEKKEKSLRNLGANSYVIVDKDADTLQFLESSNGQDGHKIYKEFAEFCNLELSKCINGQTMTADAGSSRSQGEVHERILNEFTEADLRFLEDLINYSLFPKLIENGYPLEGYTFVYNQFLKEFLNPATSVLEEQNTETPKKPNSEKEKNEEQEKKKELKPKAEPEDSIANFTKPSAQTAEGEIKAHIIDMRSAVQCCSTHHQQDEPQANIFKPIVEAFNKFTSLIYTQFLQKKEIMQEELQPFISELTLQTGTVLSKAYEESFKEAKSNPFNFKDEFFVAKAQASIFQFSGVKSYAQLIALRDVIFQNQQILPFTKFREKALAINTEWNQTWMRTEYDSVIQSANMASKWQDIEAQKAVYPLLRYKTIGDDRVRLEHEALNGITLPVSDSFWNSYYPPNGWNCRCTVEQLQEATITKITTIREKTKIAKVEKYFKQNIGKTPRVFNPNHKYFQALEYEIEKLSLDFNETLALRQTLGNDELKNYLVKEKGYIDTLSNPQTGAFIVYPSDYDKSDIQSAEKAWEAIKNTKIKVFGIKDFHKNPADKTVNFDALVNGFKCDIKVITGRTDLEKMNKKLERKISEAKVQNAESVLFIVSDSSYTDVEYEEIKNRLAGKITANNKKSEIQLKQATIVFNNEKVIQINV